MELARILIEQLSRAFRGLSGHAELGSSEPVRVSSFPFVSGDTFRLIAGTEFLEHGIARHYGRPSEIAFAKGDLVARGDFVSRFADWAATAGLQRPILLIHNSDLLPPQQILDSLTQRATAVFCVNLTEESSKIRALPIGLENAALNNNGRLDLYLGEGTPDTISRNRKVLSSFHESNNPEVRGPLINKLQQSRFGYDGFQWKRAEYRAEVRRTQFVIAPPGNGNDTHRTWEAIYLGAIPVVLKSHLAPSLVAAAPVLAVEDYDEFLSLTDREMDEVYDMIRMTKPEAAFASHWVSLFLRLIAGDNPQ